jgi:hypothetical protein
MRLIHIPLAAAAFYVGLSISVAPAQQTPPDAGQQQRAPADPQGQDPLKSQQGGKEEPSSQTNAKSAVPPETNVFVDGKLAVPGAPADSQTVPAKFSERNARLDEMPIMALPLGLSDEQKRQIAASVAKSDAPVTQVSAKPADVLPAGTPVSELPADVKASVPAASDLHFVRTSEKIYLVRAPNMVVTEEIAAN